MTGGTAVAGCPPPPTGALDVFGPNAAAAAAYAELLCTVGVERGLVGPREPERVWDRHVVNSAALAELVPAEARVCDVGSGAGLPGIPLALARPDLRVTLLEPMQRRVEFLREVVAALGLDLDVVRARAEDGPAAAFDVVVARAVAPLVRLVPLVTPLLRPAGHVLALKGRTAAAEVADARGALRRARLEAEVLTVGTGGATTSVVRLERRP